MVNLTKSVDPAVMRSCYVLNFISGLWQKVNIYNDTCVKECRVKTPGLSSDFVNTFPPRYKALLGQHDTHNDE